VRRASSPPAVLTGVFYAYQRWRFADFDASEPHDD
jgi:hypothetical protein